ncbi:antibiotic biosynthesis monooxygenase family protein [Arthrobacter sp. MAHUQ-56]
MITEHALLPVIPGQEEHFETAFEQARTIIASMPGFISLSLSRSIESPNTYLLLVEWETVEDHTIGFRGSLEYQRWRHLLHRFYEPFPVVEHYREVSSA